ncbi:alpha-L-arabinofuranosidase C-terminal domain-containing protein, partial [Enterobacter hormaechei]|uniref:alpha-L-arabinofuranosidase C-terminal domain-containing protein n=1 Tax=Enterobacter hormaechei TaxID=158836 RepID=UPI000AB784FC
DRVKMASLAQLVNVIAPIFTEAGGGVIRQTIFWPFAMVANVAKGSALRHFIPAGTFSSKYGDARRIQSAVVHNAAAGKLYLFALNSDFHDSGGRVRSEAVSVSGATRSGRSKVFFA